MSSVPPPPPPDPQPQGDEVPRASGGLSAAEMSAWLYIAGGAGFVVGSLLPWIVIHTLVGQVSASGLDRGDGFWTLGVGLGIASMGIDMLTRGKRRAFTRLELAAHYVVSAGVVGFAWYTTDRAIDAATADGFAATHGTGSWVLLLGMLAVWAAANRAPRR